MGVAEFRPTTLAAAQSYVRSRTGSVGATEAEIQNGIFILLLSSPDLGVV
jgi:hypothetical protein